MSENIFIKKLISMFAKILILVNQSVNQAYLSLLSKYFYYKFYRALFYSSFCRFIIQRNRKKDFIPETYSQKLSLYLRYFIRAKSELEVFTYEEDSLQEQLIEINYLMTNHQKLQPMFKAIASKRVLYAGQAYYNAWYLSRSLRNLGWKADVLNWDLNPSSQIYYHGEDFRFGGNTENELSHNLKFYIASLYEYDIFHFSNAHGICFGFYVQSFFREKFGEHSEIFLLKNLGKKVVYSNNGCLDGVSQTSFSKWQPTSVCDICLWQNEPNVCSDDKNLAWGKFRNKVSDFQCLLGGNRVDYNDDPSVHEAPEFYCLDKDFWHPQLDIPEKFKLEEKVSHTVWLYHAVGNLHERTINGVNIKSSHIYLRLVGKLQNEGLAIDLINPTGIPNKEVRFLQAQADIFLEMLTFGWFGANAREAMMLGKPVICYIRPEWLESLRQEIPDYAAELPIISATPDTVEEILRDLIANPDKHREIGQRSRDFSVKWHSAEAGGRRFDQIYTKLLQGDPLLRIMT
jgi:hypothetical protein